MNPTTEVHLKPIPTKYAGITFRSRLEARWAVFFDALGVRWEYEREGYQLPSGWYVPDFWLPDWGRGGGWVEIKPRSPSELEERLLGECGGGVIFFDSPVAMADGPEDIGYLCAPGGKFDDGTECPPGFMDNYYLPCICKVCGRFGIEFEGRSDRICRHEGHGDRGHSFSDPRMQRAIDAARRFNFWNPPTVRSRA